MYMAATEAWQWMFLISKKLKIYFKNFKKCPMIPTVIYADFEAILEAIDQTENLP